MYEIILILWYPENPGERVQEVYMDKGFIHMSQALDYLKDNLETIEEDYPIDGEIIIRYNSDRLLTNNIISSNSNIKIARKRI